MSAILTWSLESTLVLSILFAIYLLCFRNNTAIVLRRHLLLAIVTLSLFAPFVKIDNSSSSQWAKSSIVNLGEQVLTKVSPVIDIQPDTIEAGNSYSGDSKTPLNYQILIYQIGLTVFGIILFIQLGKLVSIILSGKWSRHSKFLVVRHKKIKVPSSFLFAIILPNRSELSERERTIIIEHERQHLIQRHSLDLLAISILQAFMWFNPLLFLIRREFKNLHEVLADKATLEKVDYKDYFEALLATTFTVNAFSLSHCFGQKNGLLHRIKLIKKQQTTMKRTRFSLALFTVFTISVMSINSLKGQQSEIASEMIPQKDALSEITKISKTNLNLGFLRGLTAKHQRILSKLEKETKANGVGYRYFENNSFYDLLNSNVRHVKPLFIGKLSNEEKLELISVVGQDTAQIAVHLNDNSGKRVVKHLTNAEMHPNLTERVQNDYNYIVIYEYEEDKINETIYDYDEVDKVPEVLGGKSDFERSIALEFEIPKTLDKSRMPKNIDFSFVVRGGGSISNIELLTELKGNYKKNKDYYLFFGEVHDMLRTKIADLYPWKRGIKDGKEVLVRVQVSIPTKYMM